MNRVEYRRPSPARRLATLLSVTAVLTTLPVAASTVPLSPAQAGAAAELLLPIQKMVAAIRRAPSIEGVPDYAAAAVGLRRQALQQARVRLAAIDPSGWTISDQVDYLLVRSQINAVDFELRVVRSWERDPGLAVDLIRRTAFAGIRDGADDQAELRRRLATVPKILDAARGWLTAASGELAGMAIRQLSRSDGINQGEPRRPVPPEGVIGWYEDLMARAREGAPDLVPDVTRALDSVRNYRDWLEANQAAMKEPAWVGLEDYDWYLRNVLLMPFTAEDLRVIATRELDRARTFLAIERYRNRDLPEIIPAASAEEHAARVEQAEALIRDFMTRNALMSIPEGLPERFETDAFWIVRAGGKRHFWEELTYRDPLNNHIHASIPGHRFDALVQRMNTDPIRSRYRDGVRSEGWAFYIEEMFLQAGLLDERPRAKELFYIAQLKRAARVPAELAMQAGAIDLHGAVDYLVEQVPLMEPDLARYDLSIYLRRPTYGMNYVMGKVQLEALLSDRALQLGEGFDLGAFHDEFLNSGPIPISLIRWEMTGLDDEIRKLW